MNDLFNKNTILVINKSDLNKFDVKDRLNKYDPISVSFLKEKNINELLTEANDIVEKIDHLTARQMMKDPNTIILDVREESEVRDLGKIKGAIHVPRGLLEFIFRPEDHVDDPAQLRILVYCAAGARSALAAKTLIYIGYQRVYNIGGFKEWIENGGEIEK